VNLREGTTPTHLRRLRAGRLEVAVIALGPDLPYPLDDLRPDLLLEGGLLVAVPSGHRLARRDSVDVADLEDDAWIVGDAAGGDPQFGVWPARLGLVATGLGLAVVPAMVAGAMPPGVELVAVDDPQPVRRSVVAVTRPERSPSAASLVECLREEGASIR
jgi:DNA-binding transcriptional LysR family regulator